MIGLVTWILAASVAVVAARLIPWLRRHWLAEAFVAAVGAIAAGMYATGADFGGWREIDLRAALFAFAVSLGAIALLRVVLPRGIWSR